MFKGIGVSAGIGIGRAYFVGQPDSDYSGVLFGGAEAEKARLAAEERAREEKEEEKQRKEKARLERARRAKEDKKGTVPEGVNKDDSREGLRAYVDPNTLAPVGKKTRKEQEKKALAEAEVKVTEKMDLTSLNKKNDEPDAGKESV